MKFLLLFLLSLQSSAQIHTLTGKPINPAQINTRITFLLDSLKVPGLSLAVFEKGKITYSEAFGFSDLESRKPVTNATFYEAASLSKSVFAYFALKLAHGGKLDLDKPLFHYLPNPDIQDERYKKISARMVLNHSSGLPNWRENEKMQLLFEPGTGFSYSGEAYVYLAKAIAKQMKITVNDLDKMVREKISEPMHLEKFTFITDADIEKNLAKGYQDRKFVRDDRNRSDFDPAGGLFSNLQDYATFLLYIMKEKNELLFRPQTRLMPDDPIRQFFKIDSWTSGLAVMEVNGFRGYWHGGNNLGYTNGFLIDPDKQYGFIFFSNADQCNALTDLLADLLWK